MPNGSGISARAGPMCLNVIWSRSCLRRKLMVFGSCFQHSLTLPSCRGGLARSLRNCGLPGLGRIMRLQRESLRSTTYLCVVSPSRPGRISTSSRRTLSTSVPTVTRSWLRVLLNWSNLTLELRFRRSHSNSEFYETSVSENDPLWLRKRPCDGHFQFFSLLKKPEDLPRRRHRRRGTLFQRTHNESVDAGAVAAPRLRTKSASLNVWPLLSPRKRWSPPGGAHR
jgi:hypothetical protein